MTTAIGESIKTLQETADQMRSDELRTPNLSPGDFVRQGDLYIYALPSIPERVKPITAELQLAPGTTQGSRHCLDSLKGVRMYRQVDQNNNLIENPLQGPIMDLANDCTVTHPEHAHIKLAPGAYVVTYQRDLSKESARVLD